MLTCLSWFCELSEEKILISAKTAIATHGLLNVYEILMVGNLKPQEGSYELLLCKLMYFQILDL